MLKPVPGVGSGGYSFQIAKKGSLLVHVYLDEGLCVRYSSSYVYVTPPHGSCVEGIVSSSQLLMVYNQQVIVYNNVYSITSAFCIESLSLVFLQCSERFT